MTNAFGPLVGTGGGVTCMKDVGYLTMCDDEEAMKKIASVGFRYIEVLEGNILKYENNPDVFMDMCERNGISLLGVCVGCHFIYEDAREDELFKVERVASLAAKFGARHIAFCGGSIHGTGIRDEDFDKLAKGVDAAAAVCRKHGLIPSYHPHLGALAEGPEQIDKLFERSDIGFCPDMAHLVAGGSNALEMIEKYYDRIQYVHLKDLSKDGEFNPLGMGTIDLEKIIHFLKDKGYNGDWLVEVDGYSGDPLEACQTSYSYLKGKLIDA
jgi:inosose dehydratase